MRKGSTPSSKPKTLRNAALALVAAALWLVAVGIFYSQRETRSVRSPSQDRGQEDYDFRRHVTFKTGEERSSLRLYSREREKIPLRLSRRIDTLWFWSFHPDDEIDLSFSFRSQDGRRIDDALRLNPRKIRLLPKSYFPPDSKMKSGPSQTLTVTIDRERFRREKPGSIEFWVFGEGDTAKIPVVLGGNLMAERQRAGPPKRYRNLLWLPGDEYGALSERDTLEIEEHETYLVFKNLVSERLERRFHFERAGQAFTNGLQLKPDRLVLSRKWSQDSVRLVLLSKAFFERPPRNVELVISDPKGRETLRIPLAFKPMLAATWADYVKFLYGGREIQEATTLPANPHQWQEIQVINDNLLGLSVTYQVAMDSQGVICLDGGQTEVDKNSAEKISWQRKPTDLNRITFRFKVSSEKGVFDTTFVVSVSSGSLFAEMGSFLSRNWLTVPLLLVIGAMGYLSLNLMGRIISLARRRGQHLRLLKEREREIMRLKLDLKKLEMENADLARRVGREVRYELSPSPGSLVTNETLVDKAREDLLQDINRLEFILDEKERGAAGKRTGIAREGFATCGVDAGTLCFFDEAGRVN